MRALQLWLNNLRQEFSKEPSGSSFFVVSFNIPTISKPFFNTLDHVGFLPAYQRGFTVQKKFRTLKISDGFIVRL